MAFLFADLIVLPIIDIYRKHYGMRVALLLFGMFYVAMAGAGYVVELVFGTLDLIPKDRSGHVLEAGPSWDYTTVLNIAAVMLSAILLWRFSRTGGREMLRMMETEDGSAADHHHA